MCDHIDCPCDCEPSPGVRGRTSAADPMPLPDPSPIFSRTTPIYAMSATGIHAQAAQAPYRGIERALGDLAEAEEHKVAAIREVAQSVRAVAWVALLIAGLVLAVVV